MQEIQTNETSSLQLTGRPQAQLNQILEAGELSPRVFYTTMDRFTKIKDLEDKDIRTAIGAIFTRISNLSGVREPISDFNKGDIINLITRRFASFSLEQINYAFKLDRHGYHKDEYGRCEDPTPHFQIINAEYVAKVMNKYLRWEENTSSIPGVWEKRMKNNQKERLKLNKQ